MTTANRFTLTAAIADWAELFLSTQTNLDDPLAIKEDMKLAFGRMDRWTSGHATVTRLLNVEGRQIGIDEHTGNWDHERRMAAMDKLADLVDWEDVAAALRGER